MDRRYDIVCKEARKRINGISSEGYLGLPSMH